FPANYSQPLSHINSVNPANPGCAPPTSLFGGGAFGPKSCAFDGTPEVDVIPRQEQYSGLAKASVALGEHTASVEYTQGHDDLTSRISSAVLQGLSMTAVNPFYRGQGITAGTPGLNPALPISLNFRMA